MTFLLRAAVGLALASLGAALLAPAAHADNVAVDGDSLDSLGAVHLGQVCRGDTAAGEVRFDLVRSGSGGPQVWANGALVTVTAGSNPATAAGTLTLGSTSVTTPATWSTIGNNARLDAGAASVSLATPAAAPEGPGSALVTYSATGAGASGGTTTRTVDVSFTWSVVECAIPDTTPPTIGYTLDPAEPDGANGWYRTDVAIDWSVTDDESAATTQGCQDATFATDGTHSSSCSASSEGGSAGPVTATVKRDATPPSVVPDISGELGENDWYVGDVEVSWSVEDATSGVDPSTACASATLSEDTTAQTFTCVVSDLAGNQTEASVTVKRDATDPVIVSTVTGPLGLDEWYVGDVDVAWTVTDATSDVASTTGCEAESVTADSAGTTYACTATDQAGNQTSRSVTVKRDATAPTITHTLTGAEGDNGWFVGNVDVDWTVTDAGSGVAQGCGGSTVTLDGVHDLTCSASDAAGNPAQATAHVAKDATAPEVTFTGGPADGSSYHFGDPIPAPSTCTASDETSGLATDCTVTGGGTTVGPHVQTGSAKDLAGNTGTAQRTYTVLAWTVDGFYRPVVMGGGVVNTVKAGSTVPLKFNVRKGATTLTSGIGATFSARKVGCESGDLQDPLEEFASTGGTSLRYDATGGQWIQNWATPASGKGLCYRVTLTTADGSATTADFRLK